MATAVVRWTEKWDRHPVIPLDPPLSKKNIRVWVNKDCHNSCWGVDYRPQKLQVTVHWHSTSHWYLQPPPLLSVSSRNSKVHDGDVLQPEHEERLPWHWSLPSVSLKHTRQRWIKPASVTEVRFDWTVVTCDSSAEILDDRVATAASASDSSPSTLLLNAAHFCCTVSVKLSYSHTATVTK